MGVGLPSRPRVAVCSRTEVTVPPGGVTVVKIVGRVSVVVEVIEADEVDGAVLAPLCSITRTSDAMAAAAEEGSTEAVLDALDVLLEDVEEVDDGSSSENGVAWLAVTVSVTGAWPAGAIIKLGAMLIGA